MSNPTSRITYMPACLNPGYSYRFYGRKQGGGFKTDTKKKKNLILHPVTLAGKKKKGRRLSGGKKKKKRNNPNNMSTRTNTIVEFTKVATGQHLRRVIVDKVLHPPWCHISPTMATQLLRTASQVALRLKWAYRFILATLICYTDKRSNISRRRATQCFFFPQLICVWR